MLHSMAWARILNVFGHCITSTTITAAGQHSFNTGQQSENTGLPTKFRFNIGSALQAIADQFVYDADPALKSITGSVVYFAQTRVIQPILCQCWPWPVIETALGDCTVFSGWALHYAIFLTARLAAPEVSDRALLNQCYHPPIGVGRMI